MLNARSLPVAVAGLTFIVGLILLVDRGGLIAWSATLIGLALLVKSWLKPSRFDLGVSLGFAAVAALAWVGIHQYVISTWESGEVVELAIETGNDRHVARVWVMDVNANPLVYYDADPEIANTLLAGKPLQFTRAGEVSTRIPEATRVDALPEIEANLIFRAMEAKYGDRVGAADIYFLMLGRARDRIDLVAYLIEE